MLLSNCSSPKALYSPVASCVAAEATTVYDVVNKTNHEVPKNILPPKYNTGVPADVVAGENHRDFELQSGGKR